MNQTELDIDQFRKAEQPEEWRTIPGFDAYEASNLGNIRNKITGKIKTKQLDCKSKKNPRYMVFLGYQKNGEKKKPYWVSRLIAHTFLGQHLDNPKLFAVHLNNIRKDDRVMNLRWANSRIQGKITGIFGRKKYKAYNESVKYKKEMFFRLNENQKEFPKDLDGEKWKPLRGSWCYYVSNQGRIWDAFKKRIITPHITKTGYRQFSWSGYPSIKQMSEQLHTIVAKTFIQKPQSIHKLIVDHINGNRLDNRAINLRWVTYGENNLNRRKNTIEYYI